MNRYRWLALAGWIGVAGCRDEVSTPVAERCSRAECWADPVAHWVCVDGCRTDAECPGGLVCVLAELAEGKEDEERVGSCEPPRTLRTPTSTLIEGFGVDEMVGRLEKVALPATGAMGIDFAWKAPARAQVVQCALFVCAPVIEIEQRRIVNYDQCVVAEQTYLQQEGAFSLYDADVQSPAPESGSCGRTTPKEEYSTDGHFSVTELLVGCWAYDQRGLVAATELERPNPTEIFNFHGILAQAACGDAEDLGLACVLDDGTFGVCRTDGCARRCLCDSDCEMGAADPSDPAMSVCTNDDCTALGDDPQKFLSTIKACPVPAPAGQAGTTTSGDPEPTTSSDTGSTTADGNGEG